MVKEAAQLFLESKSVISRFRTKYLQTGTIKDRPCPGRPCKITRHENNFIVMSSRHNRFQVSKPHANLWFGLKCYWHTGMC